MSNILVRIAAMIIVNHPPAGTLAKAAARNRTSKKPMKRKTGRMITMCKFHIRMATRVTSHVVMKLTPMTHIP